MKFVTVVLFLMVALVPVSLSALTQVDSSVVVSDVIQGPADVVAVVEGTSIVVAPKDVIAPPMDVPAVADPSDVQESIPIPKDDAAAIAQAGQAISALTMGQYMGGALLVIGLLVFVFRKYIIKKK